MISLNIIFLRKCHNKQYWDRYFIKLHRTSQKVFRPLKVFLWNLTINVIRQLISELINQKSNVIRPSFRSADKISWQRSWQSSSQILFLSLWIKSSAYRDIGASGGRPVPRGRQAGHRPSPPVRLLDVSERELIRGYLRGV